MIGGGPTCNKHSKTVIHIEKKSSQIYELHIIQGKHSQNVKKKKTFKYYSFILSD